MTHVLDAERRCPTPTPLQIGNFIEDLSRISAPRSVVVDMTEAQAVLSLDIEGGVVKWPSVSMVPPFSSALFVGYMALGNQDDASDYPGFMLVAFDIRRVKTASGAWEDRNKRPPHVRVPGRGLLIEDDPEGRAFWVQCVDAFVGSMYVRPDSTAANDGEKIVSQYRRPCSVREDDFSLLDFAQVLSADSSGRFVNMIGFRPPGQTSRGDFDGIRTGLRACFMKMTAACAFFHVRNAQLEDAILPRHVLRRATAEGRVAQSWKTLRITGAFSGQGRAAARGDALRALHLVRGNFATYGPTAPLFGKLVGNFWRPDHIAGDPTLGVVGKDYKLLPGKPDDLTDLYLVEFASVSRYKIGKSVDPDDQRVPAIRGGAVVPGRMIAVLRAGGKHEAALKRRFAHLNCFPPETRIPGDPTEVFHADPAILEAYRELGAEFLPL